MPGPDRCGIVEHSEDRQTDKEEIVREATVKTEHSDYVSVEGTQVIKTEKSDAVCVKEEFDEGLIKCESAPYMCTVCYEEFHDEHAFRAHVSSHQFRSHGDATSVDSPQTVEQSEDRGADKEENVLKATVKTEHSDDSLFVEEDAQVKKTAKSDADCVKEEFNEDLIKYESASYMCTVCYEEFHNEHAFSAHVSTHQFRSHGDATSADSPQTTVNPSSWRPVKNEEETNATGAPDSEYRTTSDHHPEIKLYNVMKYHESVVPEQDEALTRTRQAVSCGDGLNARTARGDAQCRAARATHDEPAASTSSAPHTGPRTRTFICDVCQRAFKQKSRLVIHMRTHTGEKPYSCDICSFKCAERGGLVRHKRTHTGEKPYSCEMCCYKSTERGGLVRHMRTHTGEKPFSCELCSFRCKENTKLVDHMRTHTGEKPFSCEICNYKFKHRQALVKHAKTHTGEKPYSCKVCVYKCREKYTLARHMRTHTGVKPYSCELCSYKCSLKSKLVDHVRTHTGEKPYNCELCSYKSTQKTHLINHVRTHTGEKPFSCDLCNRKFTQKINLVYHARTHTGEKPFSCELCSYRCTQKSHLINHARTHTGEKSSSSKKKKKK